MLRTPKRKRSEEAKHSTPPTASVALDIASNNATSLPFFTKPVRLIARTRSALTEESYGTQPLVFEEKEHTIITHKVDFTQHRYLVSAGHITEKGPTRELLLIDMESPALQTYLQDFLLSEAATPDISQEKTSESNEIEKTPIDFIPTLLCYVRKLFTNPYSEEKINALTASNNTLKLEKTLEHNIGSCRHLSAMLAYLLTKLLKDTHDHVYCVRGNLTKDNRIFPHVGVVYVSNNKTYFLDATKINSSGKFAFFEFSQEMNCASKTESFYGDFSFHAFWAQLMEYFHPQQYLLPSATRKLAL